MLNLTQFYNHEKALKSVKEGLKIVNNTNFDFYARQRKLAIRNFRPNDIVVENTTQVEYKVLKVLDEYVEAIPSKYATKKGIRKGREDKIRTLNPCHIKRV